MLPCDAPRAPRLCVHLLFPRVPLSSDQSKSIRQRLTEIFKDINESIVHCLKAAVDAGELSASTDVREVASFLYSSWQGAILQSKVEQSSKPLERFNRVLFSQILH